MQCVDAFLFAHWHTHTHTHRHVCSESLLIVQSSLIKYENKSGDATFLRLTCVVVPPFICRWLCGINGECCVNNFQWKDSLFYSDLCLIMVSIHLPIDRLSVWQSLSFYYISRLRRWWRRLGLFLRSSDNWVFVMPTRSIFCETNRVKCTERCLASYRCR